MLSFKLFDIYEASADIVPIAGILAADKTSKLVQVDHRIEEYFEDTVHELTSADTDYLTPFYAPSYLTLTPSDLDPDLIVSIDKDYNVYYDLSDKVAADPDVHLYYIEDGVELTNFRVEFLDADSIRIHLFDEDVAKGPLQITFSRNEESIVQENYPKLIDSVAPLYIQTTDWSLALNGDYLEVQTTHADLNATTIYVKQYALSRVVAYMPFYYWYQEWYMHIRIGSLIGEKNFITTRNHNAQNPSKLVIKDQIRYINRGLIKVSYHDLDTSVTPKIYFDDVEQTDIVDVVNCCFGMIQLNRLIPVNVTCTVTYEINSANWIEANKVDYNPHKNHFNGTMTDITSASVRYFLQPIVLGGNLLYSISSEPGVAFYEETGSQRVLQRSWIPLTDVRTLRQKQPGHADIRSLGGGIKDDYKEQVSWRDFTDWGFFDGQPIDNIAMVIRLPRDIHMNIYNRYQSQGLDHKQSLIATEKYITDALRRFAPAGVNLIIQDKNKKPFFIEE